MGIAMPELMGIAMPEFRMGAVAIKKSSDFLKSRGQWRSPECVTDGGIGRVAIVPPFQPEHEKDIFSGFPDLIFL